MDVASLKIYRRTETWRKMRETENKGDKHFERSGERSVWALFGSTDGTHKMLNVSMQQYRCLLSNASPWIVKHETHKPFLSFVFQKGKKNPVSPQSWLNMACFEPRYIFTFLEHIQYPRHSSPVYLSETVSVGFPYHRAVCSCLPVTPPCARKQSVNLRYRDHVPSDHRRPGYCLPLIWSASCWSEALCH